MTEPLLFIDSSEIVDGKLDDVKSAMGELAAFVRVNEPRVLSYNVYVDETAAIVTVVQIHPDSASMEFHLEAASHLFPRFADLLTMRTMDVYGSPTPELLERLHAKASMLGLDTVGSHRLHTGSSSMAERAQPR